MFEFFITIVIAAVVLSFVSKKIIAVVCKAMGWDNPFVSVKELMRQGHSFPEAMAISHAKRSEFQLKGFIYGASKLLPFGKKPGEWGFGKYMEYENNRIREAEEKVNDYGGKISDYL